MLKTNYRIRRGLVDGLPADEVRPMLIKAIWDDFDLESDRLKSLWAILAPGQKAFFAISLFEAEVFNGGIEQFFFNGSGNLADEALDGFKLLAADKYIEPTERVYALFPNQSVPKERESGQKVLEKISREDLTAAFDAPFYELNKLTEANIDSHALKYLAAHPEDFFVTDAEADALEAAEREQQQTQLREMLTKDYRIPRSEYKPGVFDNDILHPSFADNLKVAIKAGDNSQTALLNVLTPGQKAMILARWLLVWGGLQSFLEANGHRFVETITGLKLAGAHEQANLLEDIWRQLPEKPDQIDRKARRKTFKLKNADHARQQIKMFDAWDESFEKLNKDKDKSLDAVFARYIEDHPEEFFKD